MFREVEECRCEWLWGSFWLPFGAPLGHFFEKVAIRGAKTRIKKKASKIDEKRERGKFDKWGVKPLKE